MTSRLNSVQEFYKDKSIFITGGSGFMGKVLIEKLLYSCSDLKELIIIMRPKRGKSAKQRVEDFKKLPLFKRIMDEKPEVMEKIIPVWGEITKVNLGLSDEDLKYVTENAQIVFHLAASLKLEATLKPNILMNLTATKYVLDLAKEMKKLIQIVHTSTAFCNVEQDILEEKVYESPHRPLDLIQCAEWMSESAMKKAQKELMGVHSNTYTYTKLLAEILIRDIYAESNLPVCIVRPSIVTPSYREPVVGWVDSLNGASGIIVAAGKGVLRCLLLDISTNFEVIPVDVAINGLIMVAKDASVMAEKPKEVPVYNLTIHQTNRMTYSELFEVVESMRFETPFSFGLWYPKCTMTMNKYYFMLNVLLFQWIPAYFIDFLLMIFGQKRFMIRVQEKIATGMDGLKCFTLKDWDFRSDKFYKLVNKQSKEEYEMFFIDSREINTKECMKSSVLGGRIYCCKDPVSTIPTGKIVIRIQYIIDRVVKSLLLYWLLRKVLIITGFIDPVVTIIQDLIIGSKNFTSH